MSHGWKEDPAPEEHHHRLPPEGAGHPWPQAGRSMVMAGGVLRPSIPASRHGAAITGHTSALMLKHYRTVSSDDRRKAIERAGLGQIPAGTVLPLRTRSREDN